MSQYGANILYDMNSVHINVHGFPRIIERIKYSRQSPGQLGELRGGGVAERCQVSRVNLGGPGRGVLISEYLGM